jgi:hypothetical protein
MSFLIEGSPIMSPSVAVVLARIVRTLQELQETEAR